MDALRTLEILIASRTPFIAIETLEEERVEQALERVAQRLRIPLRARLRLTTRLPSSKRRRTS